MSVTLTVRDETTAGDVYEMPLELPSERITVRELIRERVYQEVKDFNLGRGSVFRGLVQPTDTERIINGNRPAYRFEQRRQIDWRDQYEKALEAFSRNLFLILVDDKQATSLDEEFVVNSRTQITFIKLVPLVGG